MTGTFTEAGLVARPAPPASAAEASERVLRLFDGQREVTSQDLVSEGIAGSNLGALYLMLDLEKAGEVKRSGRGWRRARSES